jgi:hypothetical protein
MVLRSRMQELCFHCLGCAMWQILWPRETWPLNRTQGVMVVLMFSEDMECYSLKYLPFTAWVLLSVFKVLLLLVCWYLKNKNIFIRILSIVLLTCPVHYNLCHVNVPVNTISNLACSIHKFFHLSWVQVLETLKYRKSQGLSSSSRYVCIKYAALGFILHLWRMLICVCCGMATLLY